MAWHDFADGIRCNYASDAAAGDDDPIRPHAQHSFSAVPCGIMAMIDAGRMIPPALHCCDVQILIRPTRALDRPDRPNLGLIRNCGTIL